MALLLWHITNYNSTGAVAGCYGGCLEICAFGSFLYSSTTYSSFCQTETAAATAATAFGAVAGAGPGVIAIGITFAPAFPVMF